MSSNRTKIVILLGILVAVIVVGGGAAYWYVNSGDEKGAKKTDPEKVEKKERVVKDAAPQKKLSEAEKARREALKRREAAIKARARQQKGDRVADEPAEEGDEAAQGGENAEESEQAAEDGSEGDERDEKDEKLTAKEAEARRIAEERAEKERAAEKAAAKERAQAKKNTDKKDTWKSAVLQVVTNFDKADITINGIAYPEYLDPGEPEGVVLPAGGPYDVRVTYNGNTKAYRVNLQPNETRLLMVELTGFSGSSGAPSRPTPRPPPKREAEPEKKEEKKEEAGKVTVYSKPSGVIIIDGNKSSEKTPGTVEVENGRHEVQVEYEHGETSEKKIIRVRQGSRIKLFFRARNPPKD